MKINNQIEFFKNMIYFEDCEQLVEESLGLLNQIGCACLY